MGGGLAVGGQFKLYRRFYMDISMVYEKYLKPASVKQEISIIREKDGQLVEEKHALDEPFNYFSMRIYFGYQLVRD
ncbi:MAG: hypothetical protein EOP53_03595 [Sphingobacteriales bacterium]|nr:MAG: hypothetical protein EOP53_03595 [Sphingobacteriales bacterium]